jgi:hypothetical protein
VRALLGVVLMIVPLTRVLACSCAGPGNPCSAAGRAAAVFTGTVLDIIEPARPLPGGIGSSAMASRPAVGSVASVPRPFRMVRMQVGEVLTGIGSGQKQVEIVTGLGGGDCGYAFQVGLDYVVYAYKNAEGRLETGICSRTRPITQAAEDLEYFRAMANAPETGEIRVRTALGKSPGRPGVPITAERDESRYPALTNAAGEAVFTNLPPGTYTIHAELDGDLPDDPLVQLHAKACLDVTLFRTLRINGRVMTSSGVPASRIEVHLRSAKDEPMDGAMTGPDGRYELRIIRPGQYYLGINLNHTATRDTPYPRWFYPGTGDPTSATRIDFSGHPEARTYDLILPDRQSERTIDGIVLRADGQPQPRSVLTLLDASQAVVGQAFADQSGRFNFRAFARTAYQLHAVWPGMTRGEAASAVPMNIEPDTNPLSLRLTLTQPGNSFLDRQRIGIRR